MAQARRKAPRKAPKKKAPRARAYDCAPTPQRNRFVGAIIHMRSGAWKILGCNTKLLAGQATYTIQNVATGRRSVIEKSRVAAMAKQSPAPVDGGVPYAPYPRRAVPRGVPVAASKIAQRDVAAGYVPFLKRAKTLGRRVILDEQGRLCGLNGQPYKLPVDDCDPVTGRRRTRNGRFKKGRCGPGQGTPRAPRATRGHRAPVGEPGSAADWEDDNREPWEVLRDERLAKSDLVIPQYRPAYQRAVRAGVDVTIGSDGVPRESITGDVIQPI